MDKDSKPHGRTLFDLIAEHPKRVLTGFILIVFTVIIVVYILVKNKYDVTTPYASIKAAKDATSIKQVDKNQIHKLDSLDVKLRKTKNPYRALTKSTISAKNANIKQPTISVTSSNQSGGQTAYQITNNNLPEPRILSQDEKEFVLKSLPKEKIISIGYVIGVQDGISYGKQILDFLNKNGYKVLQDIFPVTTQDQFYGVAIEPAVDGPEKSDLTIIINFPKPKSTQINN